MKHQQQGMVLLISLLLLLMLTIIAITAASQSNLQLRISSNSQQQNIAFQTTESGLSHWTNAFFCKPSDEVCEARKDHGELFIEPRNFGALLDTTIAGYVDKSLFPEVGADLDINAQTIPYVFSISSQGCDESGAVCARHRVGLREYMPPGLDP